ncbi:hypothetical protein DZF79_03215 [Vibrio parahaemolyticus]|nr:hypothetical protein [Vibrio parahaemolyticus]
MNPILISGTEEHPEKILVAHGSPTKEIKELRSSHYSGENGAEHGVAVYLCGAEDITTPMMYAGESGSVYLSELDISTFIKVSYDDYLTYSQSEAILDYAEKIEDLATRTRVITDLQGRDEREFSSEEHADAFYDARMEEINELGLPDRYEPEFESDRDGNIVVSFSRDEVDRELGVTSSTKLISDSLKSASSILVTEVFSEISDGLIFNGDEPFIMSYRPVPVKKEMAANLGIDGIRSWIESEYISHQHQKLTVDLDSFPKVLYIGEGGRLSENRLDVYPIEGELLIEPKPRKKIFFEGMTAEHPLTKVVLSTLHENYPHFSEAQIRFDNNPAITLSEMLTKLESKQEDDYLALYHGTSSELLPEIAENGLMCRDSSGASAHYFNSRTNESLSDRVYFGTESAAGCVRAAAASAVRKMGGFEVILEYRVPKGDIARLLPDEDSKKVTYKESINFMGTCAILGNVSPENIEIAPASLNKYLDSFSLEYAKAVFSDNRGKPSESFAPEDLSSQKEGMKAVGQSFKFK